ncbi:unnamed protein product [Diatraea saccharalis]|uniref:Uncharacterized protein n=1 Tax=Diatraea saccharalis TaxID=40085 RepID=A0A9N9QTC3_9NEOP|nr:unnamed protein product [Diatraea saccharalis]
MRPKNASVLLFKICQKLGTAVTKIFLYAKRMRERKFIIYLDTTWKVLREKLKCKLIYFIITISRTTPTAEHRHPPQISKTIGPTLSTSSGFPLPLQYRRSIW